MFELINKYIISTQEKYFGNIMKNVVKGIKE